MSSSQSAILAIKRRPRWCAGSVALQCHQQSSTLLVHSLPAMQEPFPRQAASQLHHNLRLLSSLVALALPNQRSAHGSGCPFVTAHRQSAASQEFAPTGQLFALFRTHAPGNHHAALLSPKNQSRCFSLSRRGASRSHGFRPATSHPDAVAS